MICRSLRASALTAFLLGTMLLPAADLSVYRGFRFGAGLEPAAEQAGLKPDQARIIHKRPAVIQELEWRPRSEYQADSRPTDPVRDSLLRFYNGNLFQIVTTYDRDKISGMTESDMVKALSVFYGSSTKPAAEIPYHSNYGEFATVLARWEDAEHSYNLIRTGDRTSFAMVLNQKRLNALAQAAIVEAVRLDAVEAPQRALDVQKQQQVKESLVLDQARSANLPNFRP